MIEHERKKALRALLMEPLLCAGGPRAAEFGLVRRHAAWLKEWLSRYPGWSLQLTSEVARLRKTPPETFDATRPARDPDTGEPFTRRRYVLLCLALAALERGERQTTLGALAESVLKLVAAEPALAEAGIEFDMTGRDQRRDLVHTARFLLSRQVIARVHGDEQQFIDGSGDALYNVNRPALAAMLNVRRGPSTIDEKDFRRRLERIAEEPLPDTEEGRNRRIRSYLTRKLLDDPVLYYQELDEEQTAYLTSQRTHITRAIEEATGLVAEVRKEGLAMVDPGGALTDLAMPEEGTDGHHMLLLAEHLAAHLRRHGPTVVGQSRLEALTAELIKEHKSRWRKSTQQPGAEVGMTERALERLVSLRLIVRTPEGVIPLWPLARYALEESTP